MEFVLDAAVRKTIVTQEENSEITLFIWLNYLGNMDLSTPDVAFNVQVLGHGINYH